MQLRVPAYDHLIATVVSFMLFEQSSARQQSRIIVDSKISAPICELICAYWVTMHIDLLMMLTIISSDI